MNDENYREKDEPRFEILGLSNEPSTRQKQINYLKEIQQNLYNDMISKREKNVVNRKIIDEDDIIYKQVLSGFFGFVVGDALGVPFEFAYREKLDEEPVKEMVGYGSYLLPEGTWSDDTSMTIATMDSISKMQIIDYKDIMHKFSQWYKYEKYTAIGYLFDIGKITKNSILNYIKGVNPVKCGGKDVKDNGNGSLMRMLPIAYYLNYNNFSDDEETEIINNISSLTHGHEVSCLGCKIYCDYVKQLLNGVNKIDALEFVRKQEYNKYYSEDSISYYKRILLDDISKVPRDEIYSSGYVVDTLEACLWSTLNSDNYTDGVLTAVNLGRDTDTVAAITGSLVGIIYGKEQIPKRWLDKLKKREYIEGLVERFAFVLRKEVNKNKTR